MDPTSACNTARWGNFFNPDEVANMTVPMSRAFDIRSSSSYYQLLSG